MKTKQVSYIDPTTGKRVVKTVQVPPPAKVTNLPCGAEVQEIESMEALTSLWSRCILGDLATPLTSHSRQVLAEELKKALTKPDEVQAIDALAETWQPTDDVVLRVIGRLNEAIERQKQKRGSTVARSVQLKHEKALLTEQVDRLQAENRALTQDVTKVVNERDALKRGVGGTARAEEEARAARLALRQATDDQRCISVKLTQTEQALTQAINEGAAVKVERDKLLRDGQRNLELALAEYEGEVVQKLAVVAGDHNEKSKEVVRLNGEISALKGENNILKSRIEDANRSIATVKERAMNNEQNTVETEEATPLKAGDEVFCKVSGEGPFVLLTQVEEAQIEYANPISNKRNSFAVGKLPIHNAWLVRCKDGSMRTLPAPVLTTDRPKSTLSFGGLKSLITSDVTSKLVQAAIWIAMLTLLYTRG